MRAPHPPRWQIRLSALVVAPMMLALCAPAPVNAASVGLVPAGATASFGPGAAWFVSASQGWALGTVKCGAAHCAQLLRTSNGGGSWAPVHLPAAVQHWPQRQFGPPLAIRFADSNDGWIFSNAAGEELDDVWSTHNGGEHWTVGHFFPTAVAAGVEDIEASGGVVTAAVVVGSDVDLFSAHVTGGSWQRSLAGLAVGAGPVPGGQLALAGSHGWFIENNRVVVSGAREVSPGHWAAWAAPCSKAGGPAVLVPTTTTGDLDAVCTEGVWTGQKISIDLLSSHNAGTGFAPGKRLPVAATSVGAAAAAGPSVLAVGTNEDLEMSFDGGTSWQKAYSVGPLLLWQQVNFWTPQYGTAILLGNDGQAGVMLSTQDSGRHWHKVTF